MAKEIKNEIKVYDFFRLLSDKKLHVSGGTYKLSDIKINAIDYNHASGILTITTDKDVPKESRKIILKPVLDKPLKFTDNEKIGICSKIGEWYLKWKDQLVDYNNRVHRLGYAKEELKSLICDSDEVEELVKEL